MEELKLISEIKLYAWVGEDEYGSGEIGLKQGIVPAGHIPLVSIHKEKLSRPPLLTQLQFQAQFFGKTIRLARFGFEGIEITV